jgi:hypothetical protein
VACRTAWHSPFFLFPRLKHQPFLSSTVRLQRSTLADFFWINRAPLGSEATPCLSVFHRQTASWPDGQPSWLTPNLANIGLIPTRCFLIRPAGTGAHLYPIIVVNYRRAQAVGWAVLMFVASAVRRAFRRFAPIGRDQVRLVVRNPRGLLKRGRWLPKGPSCSMDRTNEDASTLAN